MLFFSSPSSTLITCPNYMCFCLLIIASREQSAFIWFRTDWLVCLVVHGTFNNYPTFRIQRHLSSLFYSCSVSSFHKQCIAIDKICAILIFIVLQQMLSLGVILYDLLYVFVIAFLPRIKSPLYFFQHTVQLSQYLSLSN